MPDVPTQYSRRQLLAIERPEARDRQEQLSTNDPHKRKVVMVEHDKKRLQLVTALTVDLDAWPEWHASCGYLDYNRENRDYFVERRLWSDDMWEAARREMRKMVRMPYEVVGITSKWTSRDRPSEWHVFFRVTAIERDWITAILCGGVKPTVFIKDPRQFA